NTCQVVGGALRQPHFIGQQAKRTMAGDAAAIIRMGDAAVDDGACRNNDAAILYDVLIDLRSEDCAGAVITGGYPPVEAGVDGSAFGECVVRQRYAGDDVPGRI